MKRVYIAALSLFLSVIPHGGLQAEETEVFWDIPVHYVYEDAIAWMQESNFVQGFEDGSFKPGNQVSRAEALQMILSIQEFNLSNIEIDLSFEDVAKTDWFAPAVQVGLNEGILAEGTLFRPADSITLAEALRVLLLASELEVSAASNGEWYQAYLDYAAQNGLIVPEKDYSYNPAKILTRGELADLLHRLKKGPLYTGEVEFGTASFYSYRLNGVNTASGVPLYTYGHMAAHKTLPFGTKIKVTNLDNNLSTIVTIVDRGPYVEARILDLTPAAFEELGKLSTGLLRVRMEVLESEG